MRLAFRVLRGALRDRKESPKRARILASAAELFSQYGYRKSTMDEIAIAAGVGKGTVYLYFKDKEALLGELVLQHYQQAQQKMEQAVRSAATPRASLAAYFGAKKEQLRQLALLGSSRLEAINEAAKIPFVEELRSNFLNTEIKIGRAHV